MQRIHSFDLARGFTVLSMPMIHVVILYSQPQVQTSLLGDILGFIAEGPGAQLFMLIMGINFTFSKNITKQKVLKRFLILLSAAYTLNIFKFIIPLSFKMLSGNLLAELHLRNDLSSASFFFFLGDILHFAAIAYLILYVIQKLRHYYIWSAALAITVVVLSPYVWDQKTGINFIDHILVLFNGHPPETFFPVFPWLVYPLMGITLGYLLKHNNTDYLLKSTGITGIVLIIISCCLPATTSQTEWLPFYRTEPADTMFHLGFVLTWLSIVHWLSRKIKFNPFFHLLIFCSKNITLIYFIQWILICWCLVFTGYLQLNLQQSVCWMIAITCSTLLLTLVVRKIHVKQKNI